MMSGNRFGMGAPPAQGSHFGGGAQPAQPAQPTMSASFQQHRQALPPQAQAMNHTMPTQAQGVPSFLRQWQQQQPQPQQQPKPMWSPDQLAALMSTIQHRPPNWSWQQQRPPSPRYGVMSHFSSMARNTFGGR